MDAPTPAWRTVAKLSALPPRQGYLVEVDGVALALFRVGDAVHAIDNACPHRDAPLAFGDLRGHVVHCPLHAWAFDVRTGACDEFPEACVKTYPARVEGEVVQVAL